MLRRMMWLLIVGFLVAQVGTVGAVTLYDDFGEAYIKKSLWEDHDTGSRILHEFVREVDTFDEVLVLKLGTNSGIYPSRQGVSLATPFAAPLTAIRADINIVEMNNDQPTDSASAFGRIGGLFYNRSFNTPAPDCFNGDIWAELAIGDRGNGLEAWFEVEAFTSCADNVADTLTNQSLTTGVTLSIDHFYTLEISYDSASTLTFRIYDGTNLIGESTFVGPARLGPPHGHSGVLQACVQEDIEYVDGYVHAKFDQVYLNGGATAYDTFDGSQIDPLRWSGAEYVKESINGHARLQTKHQDEGKLSRLILRDSFTPYLEASVQMESGSTVSPGGDGRTRIGGIYFNQQYGPGSYNGYEGDFFAQVALRLNDAGLSAFWRVAVFTDADGDTYRIIETGTLPTIINFNTNYLLSINFTGTEFVFGCNNDTATYTIDPSVTVSAPFGPLRVIESRLWLDAGESGFIKGQFDNINVADPDYTNLSGNWTGSVTNHVVTSGSCTPDDDFTFNVTIAQNNTELLFYDDLGALSSFGIISRSRVLTHFSELDGVELFQSMADMTMSNVNHFGGTRKTEITSNCSQDSTISFTRNNQAPTADDQTVRVVEGSTNNVVTLTGTDPDGDPLIFTIASGPSHGTLSGTAPNLFYTPVAGYSGPDSFTFTVNDGYNGPDTGTVTIAVNMAGNRLPSADDQTVTVNEDVMDNAITLTGSDPDSDPLTFSVATNPSHGTLSGAAPDMLYTPDANYNGNDSFTFTVDDGNGGMDTGTVSITITPQNDDPVANDQSVTVDENSTDNPITLSGSDLDNDPLTFTMTVSPSHGAIGGTAPDMLYTPNTDYSGPDTCTFTVADGSGGTDTGTVTITVTSTGRTGGGGGGGCFIQQLEF